MADSPSGLTDADLARIRRDLTYCPNGSHWQVKHGLTLLAEVERLRDVACKALDKHRTEADRLRAGIRRVAIEAEDRPGYDTGVGQEIAHELYEVIGQSRAPFCGDEVVTCRRCGAGHRADSRCECSTRDCERATKRHKDEHARLRGSWIMACAEGWCGCGKDCGSDACDICPTEDGPA